MYYQPIDIRKLPPEATTYPLGTRLEDIARLIRENRTTLSPLYIFVAGVISLVEQPKIVWNGNAVGVMPFRPEFPYGWKPDFWENVKPVGWVNLQEGMTRRVVPFLAFSQPVHSLLFCARVCQSRAIRTGEDYARNWVGLTANTSSFRKSASSFWQAEALLIEKGSLCWDNLPPTPTTI